MNKQLIRNAGAALITVLLAGLAHAQDLGVLVLPIHEGKLTSSLLYEHLKVQDDFDTRGRADFKSNIVGAQFSYGITDQLAVAVKGGTLVDSEVDAQGSEWKSQSGYLYGIDLYNEVFPATGLAPGVQISGGIAGFRAAIDRTNQGNGTWQAVDGSMTGYDYHGAVLATYKWEMLEPYAGLRGFGSTVYWNDPSSSTSSITGHAHGNISLVVGLPVQFSKDVRLNLEGRFVNETAVTAGFTMAAF